MCCLFQIWSSKWSIKDEHNKLLSELGGAGTTTGQGGFYETHAGFPGVGNASSASDLYDSINTMSQATSQNLYTPPLAGTLGKFDKITLLKCIFQLKLFYAQSFLSNIPVVVVFFWGEMHNSRKILLTVYIDTGTGSLTPLAPITMHEMKVETTRLMDTSMSPYHPGEYCLI